MSGQGAVRCWRTGRLRLLARLKCRPTGYRLWILESLGKGHYRCSASWGAAMYKRAHLVVATIVLLAAFLSSCSGGGYSSAPAPSHGSGAVPSPRPPSRGEIEFSKYKSRCLDATREISHANVIYRPVMQMTRGSSTPVSAVVTLNTKAPPDEVLPGGGAASEGLGVACQIEGRLSGDAHEFEISPSGWESRSLVGEQDARWTWVVTPTLGGTRPLVMELRPVVKVAQGSALQSQPLTTVPFVTQVNVHVPADQAVTDWAARAKAVFDSLSGAMKALTALIAAIVGLAGALGIRKLWQWLQTRRQSRRD